jgi:hypothetical protein
MGPFTFSLQELFPDPKTLNEFGVTVRVFALQVIQQSPALADQLQQAAARVMVLCVDFEVFRQIVDSLAQERDLDFWGPGVAIVCLVASDDAALAVLA